MNILIAGGSGFVGTALTRFLMQHHHKVCVLTRSAKQAAKHVHMHHWDGQVVPDELSPDVVINLCGENIGNRRWSKRYKKRLVDSRMVPTQAVVDYIKNAPNANKPILLNASAIGFYPSDVHIQSEQNPAVVKHSLFSQQLVENWEAKALEAQNYGAQVSCLRFGVVIGRAGGLLQKLLPSFKLGLGASLGDASRYMSWIAIEDVCRAILFILSNHTLQPAYNLTAPVACTKASFTEALARACKRPYVLKLPDALVRFIFGEMGDELLLSNQQIAPQALLDAGFEFEYKTIESAIAHTMSFASKQEG